MSETPPDFLPDHDPKPEAPHEPESWECCQSGCDPCVYDRYWDAMACYEQALREWQARNTPESQIS